MENILSTPDGQKNNQETAKEGMKNIRSTPEGKKILENYQRRYILLLRGKGTIENYVRRCVLLKMIKRKRGSPSKSY